MSLVVVVVVLVVVVLCGVREVLFSDACVALKSIGGDVFFTRGGGGGGGRSKKGHNVSFSTEE